MISQGAFESQLKNSYYTNTYKFFFLISSGGRYKIDMMIMDHQLYMYKEIEEEETNKFKKKMMAI